MLLSVRDRSIQPRRNADLKPGAFARNACLTDREAGDGKDLTGQEKAVSTVTVVFSPKDCRFEGFRNSNPVILADEQHVGTGPLRREPDLCHRLSMNDRVRCKVVDHPLKEGIGIDLHGIDRCGDRHPFRSDGSEPVCDRILKILPDRFLDPDALVISGELHLFAESTDESVGSIRVSASGRSPAVACRINSI